jgi:hypothetical protein
VFHIGTEVLQDGAGIAVLKGEAKLDSQESKAHVPDLQEAEPRFV